MPPRPHFTARRLVAAVSLAVAAAVSLPAHAADKKAVSPAPKKSDPAPAQNPAPASPVEAAIPNPASPMMAALTESVSESGPLGLRDLIILALQRHAKLAQLRGDIGVKAAEVEAADDWKDPEIRLGWTTEADRQVRSPYTERRTTTGSERFNESSTTSGTRTRGPELGDPFGAPFTGPESGRESTREFTRYREVEERRIYPGQYRDKEVRRVYQVERTNTRNSRRELGFDNRTDDRDSNTRTTRRLLSEQTTYIDHPDDLYPDEAFGLRLRLYVPNPFEIRANVAKAKAELRLADQLARAEARDLIQDVREAYEAAQFMNSLLAYNREISDQSEKFLREVEAGTAPMNLGVGATPPPPGTPPATPDAAPIANDTASQSASAFQKALMAKMADASLPAKAREAASKNRIEIYDTERELAELKFKLALLCGIDDPNRISVSNKLTLRAVDVDKYPLPELIEVAVQNRPEVEELRHRTDVSSADLRMAKSARIPWASYIQGSYERNYADGRYTNNDFGVEVGISLPLWSWFKNDEHKVYEAEIAAYRDRRTSVEQLIRGQVAYAVHEIKQSATRVNSINKERRKWDESVKKTAPPAGMTPGLAESEVQHENESWSLKLGRDRLQAVAAYNQAVRQLERALGVDLEEIFHSASGK